ncbi:selenocysteine insertion sequence-binding protein 2 isoform X1 [Homalodisca vitripennis]|uniref:selenocysteine insertion sequence-binding protein 2 isoform X1 n=1 Tax=Homalodisca vitripennis TaxID=197043 RepID=UPI001EEA95E3|nr:selenocysteine insertion sequence-binding protein 2 isoform X1 [Homalodisca vitripennis]
MNKNSFDDDFNRSWPGLNTSKTKGAYPKRQTKVSNSSIKSEGRNTKTASKQCINTTLTNKKSGLNNPCSSDNQRELPPTMKDQPPKDLGSCSSTNNLNMAPTKSNVVVDICGYWNRIEEFNKHYYQNCHNLPENKDLNFYSFLTDSRPLQETDTTVSETKEPLTREELVLQRRLKVAARRQMLKQEKRQLKAIVSGVQVAKPDFSLEQAAEDFPALSSGKKIKKVKKIPNEPVKNEIENQTLEEFTSPTKINEKSWKPKIKDPININISQALQTIKPEKPKQVVKKVDPSTQRSVLGGNILDSDNPQRNKGKVRPDKERKPTKLKSLILSERKERRKRITGEDGDESEEPTLPKQVTQPTLIQASDFTKDISDGILEAKCALCETGLDNNPVVKLESVDNESNVIPKALEGIHSRKFREYCTNCLSEELTANVCALLEKVAQFQDRTFAQNPIKANAKRRYVAGINQTNKYLLVKKVRLLVIAPDLEKNPGKGGLDERINNFVKEAENQGVPCVFGPNRKRLGKAVFKNSLVSCVAVLSYDGAQELFFEIQKGLIEARLKYRILISNSGDSAAKIEEVYDPLVVKEKCSTDEVTSSLLATLRKELVSPADKLLKAIETTSW